MLSFTFSDQSEQNTCPDSLLVKTSASGGTNPSVGRSGVYSDMSGWWTGSKLNERLPIPSLPGAWQKDGNWEVNMTSCRVS